MFLVYYISVTTVGTWVTDWTNDGLFGDGFHIAGGSQYEAALDDYMAENLFNNNELNKNSKWGGGRVIPSYFYEKHI